jgi:hypothetical protein
MAHSTPATRAPSFRRSRCAVPTRTIGSAVEYITSPAAMRGDPRCNGSSAPVHRSAMQAPKIVWPLRSNLAENARLVRSLEAYNSPKWQAMSSSTASQ